MPKSINATTNVFLWGFPFLKTSTYLKGIAMTEEQTATANTQVVPEQKVEAEQQTATSTEEQSVSSASQESNLQSAEKETQYQSSPPENEMKENQQRSSPEQPRFFSGVLFFSWIFCTLVFLSITAGYIATH